MNVLCTRLGSKKNVEFPTYVKVVRVPIYYDCSLLVICGSMQEEWKHRTKKGRRMCRPSIRFGKQHNDSRRAALVLGMSDKRPMRYRRKFKYVVSLKFCSFVLLLKIWNLNSEFFESFILINFEEFAKKLDKILIRNYETVFLFDNLNSNCWQISPRMCFLYIFMCSGCNVSPSLFLPSRQSAIFR